MRPSIHDDGRTPEDRETCRRMEAGWRDAEGILYAFAAAVLCLVAWAFFAPRGPQ